MMEPNLVFVGSLIVIAAIILWKATQKMMMRG